MIQFDYYESLFDATQVQLSHVEKKMDDFGF